MTPSPSVQHIHCDSWAAANGKVRDLIDHHGYHCVAILQEPWTIILSRGVGATDVVKITRS